jgi:hypothetical protein
MLQGTDSFLFLGMFAKLQKMTISSVMSSYLSVCMECLGSHWKGIDES